ncbi:hypothetical protein B0H14DRAFT_2685809, partial [Mycena olivaceomarginata]
MHSNGSRIAHPGACTNRRTHSRTLRTADQIQAYIGSHKALISHPRRLPVDILREIFVACLPVDRNAVMSAQEAPLLLGRICSTWRSIVLTTPRLWASLHASFEYIVA